MDQRDQNVLAPRARTHDAMSATSNCLKYRSPFLDLRPRRSLPPLDRLSGVNPNHAAISRRPGRNCSGEPMVAAIAEAVTGPTPGIVWSNLIRRPSLDAAKISSPNAFIRFTIANS